MQALTMPGKRSLLDGNLRIFFSQKVDTPPSLPHTIIDRRNSYGCHCRHLASCDYRLCYIACRDRYRCFAVPGEVVTVLDGFLNLRSLIICDQAVSMRSTFVMPS